MDRHGNKEVIFSTIHESAALESLRRFVSDEEYEKESSKLKSRFESDPTFDRVTRTIQHVDYSEFES